MISGGNLVVNNSDVYTYNNNLVQVRFSRRNDPVVTDIHRHTVEKKTFTIKFILEIRLGYCSSFN